MFWWFAKGHHRRLEFLLLQLLADQTCVLTTVTKSARWEWGGVISSSPQAKLYAAEWPKQAASDGEASQKKPGI